MDDQTVGGVSGAEALPTSPRSDPIAGQLMTETFGYAWHDLQWFTVNAMKSAFIPFDQRLDLINDIIKPGYRDLAGW